MTSEPQRIYEGYSLVGNSEFWEAVNADYPDLARLKDMLADAYRTETGRGDATEHELKSWLTMALTDNPDLKKGISTDKIPARWLIFPDLATKFDYLMQRPCYVCMPYQKVDHIRFRLHTDPVSLQAHRQSAFKRAVKAYLGEVKYDFTDFYNKRLCVAVLYVLRSSVKVADVDNMAKPLLDALQGFAYKDDRQIDHLDTIRLNSRSADEAYIGVRIARTGIASDEDVIRPEFDVRWIKRRGIGSIDLSP